MVPRRATVRKNGSVDARLPDLDPKTVTDALNGVARGDEKALHLLLPVVYREMKRLAATYLKSERPGHTLQPTALAHEAYLRLVGRDRIQWQNRAHFLGVAARAMREILVDHARRRRAQKRGGGQPVTMIDEALLAGGGRPIAFDDLDHALNDLARLSERQARVVELRFFGGLSIEETGEVLDVSPATVKREWALARAWLYRELSGSDPDQR
jgi:RNA polymerase sigma-70 factor (ECF subfamily)